MFHVKRMRRADLAPLSCGCQSTRRGVRMNPVHRLSAAILLELAEGKVPKTAFHYSCYGLIPERRADQ